MKLKITFLLLILATLFSCGSDDEDEQLLGKYTISSLSTTNCDDPDFNLNLQGGSDGVCQEEDGEEYCILICMTFSETNLTFDLDVLENGVSLGKSTSSTTYDPAAEVFTFCPPGNDCESVTVSSDKKRITFTGRDEDNCLFTMVLEKD